MHPSPLSMKRAAFFGDSMYIDRVYAKGRRQHIEAMTNCHPTIVSNEEFPRLASELNDLEVIFSTWGMPMLTTEVLDRLPNLKALFYAAGTVRNFASAAIERGITVCSAWQANAIPVAEFALAQMLLANKGYFRNVREHHSGKPGQCPFVGGAGNFGSTVALLGVGQIGRKVIELLRPFQLKVIAFDPFLPEEAAKRLGVAKVSFEEAFKQGNIVSNHLANLPATVRMIQGCHLKTMPINATFINTGRGATVAEEQMAQVMKERPDLTALLDVVENEQDRDANAELFALPNVRMSTHIAGSLGNEVLRMADYMIEEFQRWQQGGALRYAVTKELLETMA